MRKIAAGVVILLSSFACTDMKGPTDPVVCTAIAVSSLNVTVRDAGTGARVCDAAVVAVHQGGERFELMRFPPDPQACSYSGPWEKAGMFEVTVAREGYRPASVGGIRVTADECHVIPVAVAVELHPAR